VPAAACPACPVSVDAPSGADSAVVDCPALRGTALRGLALRGTALRGLASAGKGKLFVMNLIPLR
jgi:hypothetical protein